MATHSGILAWRIPMNRGAWWAAVHAVRKSQTGLKRLSPHPCPHALGRCPPSVASGLGACGLGLWPRPCPHTLPPAEVLGRGSDGSGSSCDLQPGALPAFPLTALPSGLISVVLLEAALQIFSDGKQPSEGGWQRWRGWYNSVSERFLGSESS